MPLIRKQNEVDVYVNQEHKCVTISETDGFFNERDGSLEDIYINIDFAHIDTIISALQKCKAEIEGTEIQNG
ncbi:hypothetical protein ACG9Z8_06460 [Acinetobacter ursingii]|uniref:hypothetical protein n=1 Tax=Acinetobacter ursingii TaxID=108980 RepID=UPI003AF8AE9E